MIHQHLLKHWFALLVVIIQAKLLGGILNSFDF